MHPLRLAVWAGIAAAAFAQAPPFDVASLKPSPPTMGDSIRINLGTVLHGELRMTNVSLADILRFAFAITNAEQIDGPDWIKNKTIHFDIVAKAPPGTTIEPVRMMLQTLVVERFKLVYHREPRELSYLALSIAKKGSKLEPAEEGAPDGGSKYYIGDIETKAVTIPMLATVLSRYLREPILDETGLKGYYAVHLKWTPERPLSATGAGGPAPQASDAEGPSIYDAVQSQLGLRLEGRKGKVDVIVVDSALQTPIAN